MGGPSDTSRPPGRLFSLGTGLRIPGAGRRPYITYALMAANVAVLIILEVFEGGSTDGQVLLGYGAMYGPSIADGQYWRLLTAMFLHAGIVHLAFNVFGLWVFGGMVEEALGRPRFSLVYVLSGLVGGAVSYLLNPIAIAVGASGAVFGLMGALTAYFAVQRRIMGTVARHNLYVLLVLGGVNVVFGVLTPEIDYWAHVGGFAAGFAMGLALTPSYKVVLSEAGHPERFVEIDRRWSRGLWVVPAVAAALVLGVWAGNATLPPNSLTHVLRAERLIERGEPHLASLELDTAINDGLSPETSLGRAYYLRAQLRSEWGDINGSIRDLALAARLADTDTRREALELLQRIAEGS